MNLLKFILFALPIFVQAQQPPLTDQCAISAGLKAYVLLQQLNPLPNDEPNWTDSRILVRVMNNAEYDGVKITVAPGYQYVDPKLIGKLALGVSVDKEFEKLLNKKDFFDGEKVNYLDFKQSFERVFTRDLFEAELRSCSN